jgi:phosphatidylserine decarboxylase
MKHSGKAGRAAFKLILSALLAALAVAGGGILLVGPGRALRMVVPTAGGIWALFSLFTLYFFRDPTARVPAGPGLVLSPAHATVDVIDTATEPDFMGGQCQRVSMFLSVLDIHVQNAPVSGRVSFLKYTRGRFLNALKTESAIYNENVLLGFVATEPAGRKIGVRLIAGAIARRIVPFVQPGDDVDRGERISLIQFGSRADVYLPADARLRVKLGDKVVGGETVLAAFE